MPNPRRLSDFMVADLNGGPFENYALKLGTGNVASASGAASSAEIPLPGAGAPPAAGNVFLLVCTGPMVIRFGTTGMGAAAVDNTSTLVPAAGTWLLDAGLLATHFRHIQVTAAATFQLLAIPTQA